MVSSKTSDEYEECRREFYRNIKIEAHNSLTRPVEQAQIELAFQTKRVADYLEAIALIGVTVWPPSEV